MKAQFLNFNSVSFLYDSMHKDLISGFSHSFGIGWHAIAGSNGAGKSTLLKLACSMLDPSGGSISGNMSTYYCEQRTDSVPAAASLMLEDTGGNAASILQKLGVTADHAQRWDSLSHGERKRFQLACALWARPDVLCVDEPFNHLDADAKKLITDALYDFKGIGLLVSHDREIMDELCSECVLFYNGRIIIKRTSVSSALEAIDEENSAMQHEFRQRKKETERIEAELAKRKNKAMQADSKRSKKNLDRHDSDGRAKINLARLTGKDAVAGKLQKQMEKRAQRAADALNSIEYIKEKQNAIFLPGCKSHRNFIFKTEAHKISMGNKTLAIPKLILETDARIAVTGNNGTGKSTFLKYLLDNVNTEQQHICFIPQEITKEQADETWQKIREMKGADLGRVLTIISNLGSDPKQLLQSVSPSPGEIRKLLLALGILKDPHIIVMDEPTNHMDITSIKCLEEALKDCPCALVLVSHDRVFLKVLTVSELRIKSGEQGVCVMGFC